VDAELLEYLSGFLTDARKRKIEEILEKRTRHVTVVLEDIFHPPNASAIIRTCECFGVQDMRFIQNHKVYRVNADVAQGASKWVNIFDYAEGDSNTETCLSDLKKQGYRIVATTLRESEKTIQLEKLPVKEKLALCFGAEETGLSDEAHELADYHVKIPMSGFTQSFNISVSAALCLQVAVARLRESDVDLRLSDKEKAELRLDWHKKSIRNVDAIIKRFYE